VKFKIKEIHKKTTFEPFTVYKQIFFGYSIGVIHKRRLERDVLLQNTVHTESKVVTPMEAISHAEGI